MMHKPTLIFAILAVFVASTAFAQATRKLAPGVVTVIPIDPQREETFHGPLPLVEVLTDFRSLDWTPNYSPKTETLLELSKKVILRRGIWNYEFAFKPLRMMQVDIPQADGRMRKQLIWYLVYRVKNIGGDLNPISEEDTFGHKTFAAETINRQSGRFFPLFWIQTHDLDKTKRYVDRVIPAAQEAVQRRERPGTRLYNTVEISQIGIPLSDETADRSVWGVATWEAIDPNVDYFSIYIRGLTNAYRFVDPQGAYPPGAAYQPGQGPTTGRQFTYKTLQLNFSRPGDAYDEHEEEIKYGVPIMGNAEEQQKILDIYGLEKRLDHLWVYR